MGIRNERGTKVKKSYLELKGKLLALGGTEVAEHRGPTPVSSLSRQGRPFNQPVRLCRGWSRESRGNSAAIWALDSESFRLCTGYALSEGMWVEHSWVLAGDQIIESTHRMERYFGVVLSPQDACESFLYDYVAARYPGRSVRIAQVFDELADVVSPPSADQTGPLPL